MEVRLAIAAIAVLCLFAVNASAEIEIHEKHRFEAQPGATVVVDVSFHSVEVTAEPGSAVDVTVDITIKGNGNSAKKAAEEYRPVFKEEGDKLIIRSRRKKGWSWKSVKAKGKVTVSMPPGMNLTIDSSSGSARVIGDFGDARVVFDASSGSLIVDGAMGELHSDLSSGSVRATVSRPLDVFTSDASSGSVRLEGGAAEARVDSSSGSVRLHGLLGDADVDSSSGAVDLAWKTVAPSAKVRVDTSSGGVHLRFPPGTDLDGKVDTSSGGIRSDFPIHSKETDHAEFKGGADAVRLAVDTSSGGVRISATD